MEVKDKLTISEQKLKKTISQGIKNKKYKSLIDNHISKPAYGLRCSHFTRHYYRCQKLLQTIRSFTQPLATPTTKKIKTNE